MDGDKGDQGKMNCEKYSDSTKPRMEKKGPKPITMDKGVAPNTAFQILCCKLEHSMKTSSAAVLKSIAGCSVSILSMSRQTEIRTKRLKWRLFHWKLLSLLRRSSASN